MMEVCPKVSPHRAFGGQLVPISPNIHAVLAGCQSCAPIMGSGAWPHPTSTLPERLQLCVIVCLSTMPLHLLQISWGLYLLFLSSLRCLSHFGHVLAFG